jgi:SAM-dependent methyltransferase
MPGSWFYNLVYRFGAPWELGVRSELSGLVESGRLSPAAGASAIDLGCGTGANTLFLAEHGWDTVGVDFSPVAIDKAKARAREAGGPENLRFVVANLSAASIPGADGGFDFLLDFGTLDDLQEPHRTRMAELITHIAAPGARFLLWCFYGRADDMPRVLQGRVSPSIEPGELERKFGDDWDIEELEGMTEEPKTALFLLTRHGGPASA